MKAQCLLVFVRVIERPRGPWQTNIPTETLEIPNDVNVEGIIRFNYVPNAVWPPENLIRLAKDGDMSILEESSPKVGGKDLRYEKYRQDHLDATCWCLSDGLVVCMVLPKDHKIVLKIIGEIRN